MTTGTIPLEGRTVPLYTLNTVVVGSGAAGFNAAGRLYSFGQRDVAVVTEGVNVGTSRNTGSDKQTYYKLTLSGGEPDSVREMAETLFAGGCMDGDNALCEAALSAGGFLRLADLGVPFPQNRYGEYIGYKTDHDPRRRATSVGPYTSRRMTEELEREVREKGIPIFDKLQVVRILTDGGEACGLLCLSLETGEEGRFVAFHCKNIIYCTGGPAGMYADSVFPAGHLGGTGVAFGAGAAGQNLTEWQYGLASVSPRWNVSGTYMQALPRFVSTGPEGEDPREFLYDFFEEEGDLLTKVFLKGYQWPFDVRKVEGGSSIIDILVYLEQGKGRRVFLDYRENPGGREPDYAALSPEAREYLEKAGACFGTPLERLAHMNAPAVEFYRDRGVDLAAEPLEIALCAQHNNGGLAVDCWWQTTVAGLFAAGEAAGTHGVYRPGGSALNAGQVGSTRAARYIAARRTGLPGEGLPGGEEPSRSFPASAANPSREPPKTWSPAPAGSPPRETPQTWSPVREEASGLPADSSEPSRTPVSLEFQALCVRALEEEAGLAGALLSNGAGEQDNLEELWDSFTRQMSRVGGPIRSAGEIEEAARAVRTALESFPREAKAAGSHRLARAFRLRDVLLCQQIYLQAMSDYAAHGGGSRGSALYTDPAGSKPYPSLPDVFTFTLDDGSHAALVQEARPQGAGCDFAWRPVRPIPEDDDFFENVWRDYRANGNIY